MTQLHKAIGGLPVLAVSSYACKGLENAVKRFQWLNIGSALDI
jgi:hypothetical protein